MRGSSGREAIARYVALGVVLAVVVGAVPAGVPVETAGATPADPQESPGSFVTLAVPIDSHDAVEVRIDVARNGSARFVIEYQFELSDPESVDAFNRVRANGSYLLGEFMHQMREVGIPDASEETGRPMSATGEWFDTDYDPPVGSVEFGFRWTNFAERTGEGRYVVGDAIAEYDLRRNQSLTILWDDDFRKRSVSPAPDTDDPDLVAWRGHTEFRADEPTVELAATGGAGPTGRLPVVPIAGAVSLLLAVGIGWYGRNRWGAGAGSDAPATATGDAPAEDAAADPDSPPEELLTDEERVLRLLEERGGRMKQQDLIDAVEWSRTKASDVVNEMHEAEQIEVFRLGRENVLALPGEIDV